jgi:hypothetical protein
VLGVKKLGREKEDGRHLEGVASIASHVQYIFSPCEHPWLVSPTLFSFLLTCFLVGDVAVVTGALYAADLGRAKAPRMKEITRGDACVIRSWEPLLSMTSPFTFPICWIYQLDLQALARAADILRWQL